MENKSNSNGMAIAAMVCGIASLVLCWLSFVGLATGIVGLVLSVMARKKVAGSNGMVTAGLVCSIIGIVLGGIWTTCAMCTYCAAKKVVDAGLSSYYYY